MNFKPLSHPGFLIDMDGLLINSESVAHSVFSDLCNTFGGVFSKEIHSAILGTESDYWSKFVVEHCTLSVDANHFRETFREKYRAALDRDIALMPGALQLLDWIDDSGFAKCLVTSSGSLNTDRNLELLGIADRFPARITAETSPEGKPHPAPYIVGAQLIKKPTDTCIVLEDSMNGTISGSGAGCSVVAVPTEFADKAGFELAEFIAGDLIEALEFIKTKTI